MDKKLEHHNMTTKQGMAITATGAQGITFDDRPMVVMTASLSAASTTILLSPEDATQLIGILQAATGWATK